MAEKQRQQSGTGNRLGSTPACVQSAQRFKPGLERDIYFACLWLDSLMPNNRLPAHVMAAAVAVLFPPINEEIDEAIACFANLTSLRPGTKRFYMAEFRNVLYYMSWWSRVLAGGCKTPVYLALYEALSSQEAGPHPDLDLPRKWREGMSPVERRERECGRKIWFNHLRNRVTLVREALDPNSSLDERARERILCTDPLIAECLQGQIQRRMTPR
jgi:hypothetical protein